MNGEWLAGVDVSDGESGRLDNVEDGVLAEEVSRTKGEKVRVGRVVDKQVDDTSRHSLVSLHNHVLLEVLVKLFRHVDIGLTALLVRVS